MSDQITARDADGNDVTIFVGAPTAKPGDRNYTSTPTTGRRQPNPRLFMVVTRQGDKHSHEVYRARSRNAAIRKAYEAYRVEGIDPTTVKLIGARPVSIKDKSGRAVPSRAEIAANKEKRRTAMQLRRMVEQLSTGIPL